MISVGLSIRFATFSAVPDTRRAPGPRKEVIRMSKTKIGRNAENGKFTTVKTAKDNPNTHVVETIKK